MLYFYRCSISEIVQSIFLGASGVFYFLLQSVVCYLFPVYKIIFLHVTCIKLHSSENKHSAKAHKKEIMKHFCHITKMLT